MLSRNLGKVTQCLYFTVSILLCQVTSISSQMHFSTNNTNDAQNEKRNFESNYKIPKYRESLADARVDIGIARGLLRLTIFIEKAISSDAGDNTVYAPVSIGSALALVLLGARGETFNELAYVLGFRSIFDFQSNSQRVHERFGRLLKGLNVAEPFKDNEEVRIGTALFIDNDCPIREVYRRTAKQVYNSEILNIDFKRADSNAMRQINNWVEEQTGSKFKELLSEPPPASTKVIIVSTFYFKSAWATPFMDKKFTKRGNFFANGHGKPATSTPLMMINSGMFPYYKDYNLNCEIMGFPYKGNASTMYVVMPTQSDSVKLRELQQDLTPLALAWLVGNMQYVESVVKFPKMKLEATTDLSDALQNIGVKALFNPDEADFGLMTDVQEGSTNNPKESLDDLKQQNESQESESLDALKEQSGGNPGLYADKVLHKVFIDITETGTEAAATSLTSLSRSDKLTFRVDVPFLFFIVNEDAKFVLLCGAITSPTS